MDDMGCNIGTKSRVWIQAAVLSVMAVANAELEASTTFAWEAKHEKQVEDYVHKIPKLIAQNDQLKYLKGLPDFEKQLNINYPLLTPSAGREALERRTRMPSSRMSPEELHAELFRAQSSSYYTLGPHNSGWWNKAATTKRSDPYVWSTSSQYIDWWDRMGLTHPYYQTTSRPRYREMEGETQCHVYDSSSGNYVPMYCNDGQGCCDNQCCPVQPKSSKYLYFWALSLPLMICMIGSYCWRRKVAAKARRRRQHTTLYTVTAVGPPADNAPAVVHGINVHGGPQQPLMTDRRPSSAHYPDTLYQAELRFIGPDAGYAASRSGGYATPGGHTTPSGGHRSPYQSGHCTPHESGRGTPVRNTSRRGSPAGFGVSQGACDLAAPPPSYFEAVYGVGAEGRGGGRATPTAPVGE